MNLPDLNRQWDQMLGGKSRVRSWLELCRLPHSLSVAADPLAGALLVGAGWADLLLAVSLMLGAFFLYAGAVVLNDWHDFKTDRVENPDRPIAAGRIGRWYGLFAAIVLLCVGWTLMSVPGAKSGQIGLGLLGAILLYEFIMKGAPAGRTLPGAVRALALLMGMMLVPVEDSPVAWPMRVFFMGVLVIYSLGVAVLSQRPPDHLRRTISISGGIIAGVAVLALASTRLFFPVEAGHVMGAIWVGVLLILVGYPIARAIVRPSDATLRAAAWAAMLGTILVDAASVAFVRSFAASLPVAAMVLPVVYARYVLESSRHAGEAGSSQPGEAPGSNP